METKWHVSLNGNPETEKSGSTCLRSQIPQLLQLYSCSLAANCEYLEQRCAFQQVFDVDCLSCQLYSDTEYDCMSNVVKGQDVLSPLWHILLQHLSDTLYSTCVHYHWNLGLCFEYGLLYLLLSFCKQSVAMTEHNPHWRIFHFANEA